MNKQNFIGKVMTEYFCCVQILIKIQKASFCN